MRRLLVIVDVAGSWNEASLTSRSRPRTPYVLSSCKVHDRKYGGENGQVAGVLFDTLYPLDTPAQALLLPSMRVLLGFNPVVEEQQILSKNI